MASFGIATSPGHKSGGRPFGCVDNRRGGSRCAPKKTQSMADAGPLDEPQPRRRRNMVPALLRQVAEVYREATSEGLPPNVAVAERFQVSHRSAVRWTAEARKAGFLGPSIGTVSGEAIGVRQPRGTGELSKNVAANVRRARRARGWSVQDLAERLSALGAEGTSTASLTNLERAIGGDGRRSRSVQVDELPYLAAALGFREPWSMTLPPATCVRCSGSPPPGFRCLGCGEDGPLMTPPHPEGMSGIGAG